LHRKRASGLLHTLSALCGTAAGLVMLRVIARALLGNPANPVVQAILVLTRPLIFPWSSLWPPSELPVVELERAGLLSFGAYFLAGVLLGLAARLTGRAQEKEEAPCASQSQANRSRCG